MKIGWAAVVFLQLAAGVGADTRSEPARLRYQRRIRRVGESTGQTCVVLDAAVLANMANRGANDLRLFGDNGVSAKEIPFALTESSAVPGDTENVAASQEQVHGSTVEFHLHMPDRPWSEIDLNVNEKDFVALAEVTGSITENAPEHGLGTVTLFDFSGQGLSHSTRLALGESSYAWVHVTLRFQDVHGKPLAQRVGVVPAASVPLSRQSQILYTTVAETRAISAEGQASSAELPIAAHVPVERVRFELDPQFKADFLREVSIKAQPLTQEAGKTYAESWDAASGGESLAGEIGRVTRLDPGPGVPAIRFERLVVPAALGSNLRSEAVVRIRIANGSAVPLPIRAVMLEMRRRSLCFEATRSTQYLLRYGDAALRAPVYPYARAFQPSSKAAQATLEPEQLNPRFVARNGERSWRLRSPELVGVVVLAVLTLIGAAVLERMRRHRN